jgi:glycosyltransferase involved in cell wall biosynthesis
MKVEIYQETKKGYGQACLKGITMLKKEDIVVFLDADYSDHPDKMNSIVEPLIQDQADLVISNRFNEQLTAGAMTTVQKFGNKLSVFLIKVFWKYQYKDLGPFRAIQYQSLKQLNMQDRNFGWTIEMQIKALQNSLRVSQVNVPYRNRIGESKISGTISGVMKAGIKILYMIFSIKIRELVS